MSAVTQSRPPSAFRYEADLVDALELTFANSVFRRNDPAVETFREVPAVRGIPDLTAVRFDRNAITQRLDAGIGCLTTDTEVRAVLALRTGSLNTHELAAHTRMSRDYIRRAVLPLLEQLRWVTHTGGKVTLNPAACFVGRRVVTVEAKLKDWGRAFNQAQNQQRSADAAYIALDATRTAAVKAQLAGIAARGIGVIEVDAATGQHRVLARPHLTASKDATRLGRALIAERCLDLALRGERAGQVAPVFGWSRPEFTG